MGIDTAVLTKPMSNLYQHTQVIADNLTCIQKELSTLMLSMGTQIFEELRNVRGIDTDRRRPYNCIQSPGL